MRWPKSCKECQVECCNPFPAFNSELFGHMRVTCPLVVVDDDGVIEWEANGWPDVTPFYGSVDTSNMPDVIRDEWHRCCSIAERQWECS